MYGRGHHSTSGHDSLRYGQCERLIRAKAERQGKFRVQHRGLVDLHQNYAVTLHTTYVWVTKKEWDKLSFNERFNPSNYFEHRDEQHDRFIYAIPVPQQPIILTLWDCEIVVLHPNGDIVLNAARGGRQWETSTTEKWMDTTLPDDVRLGNMKPTRWDPSVWCIRDSRYRLTRFYNGVTLNAHGEITSKIVPPLKSRLDRDKMRPFNAAVKYFRNLAGVYIEMLEGNPVPDPVQQQFDVQFPGDPVLLNHLLSLPAEPEPLYVAAMCTSDNYYERKNNPPRTDARARFEQTLRRLRAQWTRANALVQD